MFGNSGPTLRDTESPASISAPRSSERSPDGPTNKATYHLYVYYRPSVTYIIKEPPYRDSDLGGATVAGDGRPRTVVLKAEVVAAHYGRDAGRNWHTRPTGDPASRTSPNGTLLKLRDSLRTRRVRTHILGSGMERWEEMERGGHGQVVQEYRCWNCSDIFFLHKN